MNLKSKISQLLVGGFDGPTPPKDLSKLIKSHGMGGVILFRTNLEEPVQIARLNNRLQRLSSLAPLFIMVDQEGGRVCRLPLPFTRFPPGAMLGVCNSYRLAYRVGQATARELKAVGINMNLAPVLDVNTNPANSVIGDRAFGSDPMLVSKLGLAQMVGLEDQKVLACGKHFPGHGNTLEDSHFALPSVGESLDRMIQVELKPFQHAIENRIQAIMTAHVIYKSLDPRHPATLSKKIITKLLREAMRFRGLVLTDDLYMKAVADHYELTQASIQSIQAGADLLLICREPEAQIRVIDALYQAVKKGALSEQRIDQSLSRILAVKEKMLLPYRPIPIKQIKNTVGHAEHRRLAEEILERAQGARQKMAGAGARAGKRKG